MRRFDCKTIQDFFLTIFLSSIAVQWYVIHCCYGTKISIYFITTCYWNSQLFFIISFKLCYQEDTPYIVQFKVTNKAGLYTIKDSPPVLYDLSTPTPGKVIAGKDFLKEQVWFSSGKAVTGIEVLTKHKHIL